MKVLIAESTGFAPAALELLREHADVITADLNRAALLQQVGDCDVLWVRLRNQIDAEVLDTAPHLKMIATNTTGLTHIDVGQAQRRGIEIVSLAGETDFLRDVRATAELTIGLMLSLLRNIPGAMEDTHRGHWNRDRFQGRELHRKTIGIVGYGRLGRIVARYLQAFDAEILATPPLHQHEHENKNGSQPPVQFMSLERLLPRCDLVSIHVDLNETTRGMFGRQALTQMKDGAWLINTSRGEVIDEDALLEALQSGKLAGAALDVLADEHALQTESRPLLQHARTHGNLLLTPHIGGNTFESREKTEIFLARKLLERIRSIRPCELPLPR